MNRFIRLLLLPLLLLVPPFLHASDKGLPETLRVGTSAGYPPLTFEKDGQLTGMEIDLAKAVGEQLGMPVTFVETPFEELISALNDGKFDVIMSGMSVTDERSHSVLFTDPYLDIGQMALIRTDDLVEWSRPESMLSTSRTLGVKSGTTGETFVTTTLPDASVKHFDSIDAAVDALKARQIDIFIHDAPTIWRLGAEYEAWQSGLMGLYRPLTEEYLAWAVRRGDGELASALNKALETLKTDGTLNRLRTRWIPVQVKVGN